MALNIKLTYQPDVYFDGGVHQCKGWIARVKYRGKYQLAAWGPTRKSAYMKAYRFIKLCKRS